MVVEIYSKHCRAVLYYVIGIMFFISVCCFAGLLLFSHYRNCDPFYTHLISTGDQLFPLFVMQSMGKIIGFPGLFMAGVCGAALRYIMQILPTFLRNITLFLYSSLSVILNSTASVVLEDIIRGAANCRPSEKQASFIVKGTIGVLGLLSMMLVPVVERLGGVLAVVTI